MCGFSKFNRGHRWICSNIQWVGYQVNYLDHCTIMRLICLILCYPAGEIAGIIIVPALIIAALSVTLIIYIIIKFNCKNDRHQQAIQSLESELRWGMRPKHCMGVMGGGGIMCPFVQHVQSCLIICHVIDPFLFICMSVVRYQIQRTQVRYLTITWNQVLLAVTMMTIILLMWMRNMLLHKGYATCLISNFNFVNYLRWYNYVDL